jgi:hypothetical protein
MRSAFQWEMPRARHEISPVLVLIQPQQCFVVLCELLFLHL